MTTSITSLTDTADRKILVVTPTWGAYSETFIRAHVTHLPGKVDVLYDIYGLDPKLLSRSASKASWLLDNRFFQKVARRMIWAQKRNERRLSEMIKQVNPDVILFEYGVTASHFVPVLKEHPIPFVVHFHGYDASVEDVIRGNFEEYQWLVKKAHAVVAVSSEMRYKIVSWGANEEKVAHLVYGVDEAVFSIPNGYKHSLSFLSVGRFVEKKAPHLLIRAFAKVLEKMPECKLVMVGDGELLSGTKALAKDLGISGNVDFKNSLSHEEVTRQMRQAGCFVQHSVRAGNGDSEGTPVAVIEAMATGLPVIATAHAGIKDIIEHEKTGLLVGEFDIAAMADLMIRIAREPALARKLGLEARRFVLDNLTLSKSIARLSEILTVGR